MTLKTLLLGSAATFAVVGGAQAADLSVAEPVEYVKVCDYFGTTYWYIPGTDTCLKVGGFVETNADFSANHRVVPAGYPSYGGRSASWAFTVCSELQITAKSQTEYGELDGYFGYRVVNNPATDTTVVGNPMLRTDGAYLSLGGFKAGAYGNAAYAGGGLSPYSFVDNFGYSNEIDGTFGYQDLKTFQLSWAAGGMGASVAVSDPSSYWSQGLPINYSMPLITANITTTQKAFSAGLSGGFVQMSNNGFSSQSSFGIDGQVDFNIGSMDKLMLNGDYGDNGFIGGFAPAYHDSTAGTNNGYSLMASWQHMFSKTFEFDADFSYIKESGSSATGYATAADLVWTPVTNFRAKALVGYTDLPTAGSTCGTSANCGNDYYSNTGAWVAELAVRRDW